jgi:zinc transport system ATP-binding protein
MSTELLLRADNISYSKGQRLILDRVSFEIRRGQITTIIGPNGAGKSTLTNIVNGLINNYSGVVERDPDLRIGYLPQKVYVNTLMPLSVERLLRLTRQSNDAQIEQALAQSEVGYLRHRQVRSLSEGELKRVLLARTTLGKPDLIVLDEPTAGVDVSGEIRMYQLIGELRDQLQCAVLLVLLGPARIGQSTSRVSCPVRPAGRAVDRRLRA